MEFQHINVKLFVDGGLQTDLELIIEAFHEWTARQSFDELLIDVADYRHVPDGPGVVLVGHEADYGMDHAGGRWGLLYNRKAPTSGSNQDRIVQALSAAANACRLLEGTFRDLRFGRREFLVSVNDRALAPNVSETYDAFEPDVRAALTGACSDVEFEFEREADPRRRLQLLVRAAQPFDLDSLLSAQN